MDVFIPVEKARSIIFNTVPRQPIIEVDFQLSLGMTLAADLISPDTIPPFDNSAMDGYAVCSADFANNSARLKVVGEIPAGTVWDKTVVRGTCVKIMTGAPFPAGADAVAPVEWVEMEDGDEVVFNRGPKKGQHVRLAGKDVKAGQLVLEAGEKITPPAIGMMATLGFSRVHVYKAPVVAIIATGDELVQPDEPLEPGKIRNSSSSALAAQVINAGGEVGKQLLARDNRESISRVLTEALEADLLIFAGGVSVGDYDLVKQVLDEMGMETLFWKVKQRPGKPLAFGVIQGKPVFGLPGNPVSSAICFEQYVRPALAQMLNRKQTLRPLHPAILMQDTAKVVGLHFFARGIASYNKEGQLVVSDTGPQASNLYSSMVKANCIFHIPAEVAVAPAGIKVFIEWLFW